VLVLHDRRVGFSEPIVVAAGLARATGRPVRPVGAPDLAPLGWWARRLGAVLDRPDEVRGLFRSGAVVAAPLRRTLRGPGHPPDDLVALAVQRGVPIVPVAVRGNELCRRWRLRVGEPLASPDRLVERIGELAG
jgi:hypothetical protein